MCLQQRGYLNAAPEGIDAVYARKFAGGKGEGTVRFIDIEQGWLPDHEALKVGTLPHTGINMPQFRDHGAATLGIVMMKKNRVIGAGIAPCVKGFVISQWRPDGTPNDADAVLSAVYHLGYGDVLLLEAQSFDPVQAGVLWPLEIQDAVFEVICLATALGIIVVEPAANGNLYRHTGYDLDDCSINQKNILDPESKYFRDSGAIMVAAATADFPHRRIKFSNYGKRINCYAWGEQVTTAGNYPGVSGTAANTYTHHFNGSSSAAAIVAGVVIVIQSISAAKYKTRLGPAQMSAILSDEVFGTPSREGKAIDKIGVMPDLRKIIDGYLNHCPVSGNI